MNCISCIGDTLYHSALNPSHLLFSNIKCYVLRSMKACTFSNEKFSKMYTYTDVESKLIFSLSVKSLFVIYESHGYCAFYLKSFVIISFQTYKVYSGGVFTLTRLLIPAWIVHYYVKYHLAVSFWKYLTVFV